MPKFRAMRQAGFNRISLGAQSFFDDDLVVLGRVHRSGEIERAVGAAREAGFDNLLDSAKPHDWSKPVY
jgi:oxygen-independent coproporphyrinogen-3 oxidase